MSDSAPLGELVALHEQLSKSLREASAVIDELDHALARASTSWTSKAAHEFADSWHNGFKPSVAKLCQALAAAGTDVAFQHNQTAADSGNADHATPLEPLKSPS